MSPPSGVDKKQASKGRPVTRSSIQEKDTKKEEQQNVSSKANHNKVVHTAEMVTLAEISELFNNRFDAFEKVNSEKFEKLEGQFHQLNTHVNEHLTAFDVKLNSVSESAQVLTRRMNEIETGVNFQNQDIEILKKSAKAIDAETSELKLKANKFQFALANQVNDLDEFDAYQRRAFVLLKNVPGDVPSETPANLLSKVKSLMKTANVQLEEDDVDIIHRLGKGNRNGRPRNVIIKLLRHKKRAELIMKRHDVSKSSALFNYDGSHVPPPGGRQERDKVYTEEYLTKRRHRVLKAALYLKQKKLCDVKSVTSFNGVPQITFHDENKHKLRCLTVGSLTQALPEAKVLLP